VVVVELRWGDEVGIIEIWTRQDRQAGDMGTVSVFCCVEVDEIDDVMTTRRLFFLGSILDEVTGKLIVVRIPSARYIT